MFLKYQMQPFLWSFVFKFLIQRVQVCKDGVIGDTKAVMFIKLHGYFDSLLIQFVPVIDSQVYKIKKKKNCNADDLETSRASKIMTLAQPLLLFNVFKEVLHLWTLFLKTLCIFSKNKTILDELSNVSNQKMFQGTQKSQFYFSIEHGCEVTVNNV